MALLPVSMLLTAASLADDADGTDIDVQQIPLESRPTIAVDKEWAFSYLWRLRYPGAATAYPDYWTDPISEFEFQDSSMYGRVSQLHNLSLLTLAEFGQKRLFLGVNADGLVGIHFNAFARSDDRRYLEVARMPYLKELDTDSDVEQTESESKKPVPQQMTDSW
ncbi:MAG: hypothetical protein DRR11_20845 [Gammaproteobacteria bacterium]|nr:MAG: hypothetical protein DRR11_20845 [Gammaproteobacteria bacterium]RLA31894.1 MAG: hypothetical protein DRR15_12605 [Gammaproteobacteria bacterium]